MRSLTVLSSALAAIALSGCGGGGDSVPEGTPEAVDEVVSFTEATWSMASDGESLWVLTDDESASRVDLGSGDLSGEAPGVLGVEFGRGSLWGSTGDAVVELDSRTGATLRSRPVPGVSDWLVWADGSLWAYRWKEGDSEVASVIRIDAESLRVTDEISVSDCNAARELLYAFDSVWIACKDSGHVLRVVPASTRVVAAIPTGSGPHHLAEGAGSVWVTNHSDNTVSRIDPATNTVVATIPDVGAGIGIAFAGDAIWAAGANGLGRIDPASNRIEQEIPLVPLGDYYYEIVPVEDSLWISTVDRKQVWRIPLP
jgi:YVTN family beta-propeller protein